MRNKKSIVAANTTNILAITLLIISCQLVWLPSETYSRAIVATYSMSIACWFTVISAIICLSLLIGSFCKDGSKREHIIALILSVAIYAFTATIFYPQARKAIHIPSPENVYWREIAIFTVSNDLKLLAKQNGRTIPQDEEWKEQLYKKLNYFENVINLWDKSYNSSVVINENIKGQRLDEIDESVVLMFEGPKGHSFGNEETFKDYARKNGYVYVVLKNGLSGRVKYTDQRAESLVGGLRDTDVPLTWK